MPRRPVVRRINGNPMLLAKTIEDILAHGTGPMNIPYDKIRIELHNTTGMSLDAAGKIVRSRALGEALAILAANGWTSIKTTDYWIRVSYVEPSTEPAIKRCLAGLGRDDRGAANRAVGLHFSLTINDMLYVYGRDNGAICWRSRRQIEAERLKDAAAQGKLDATDLAIAEQSAVDPEIGDKAYRTVRRAISPPQP